jgi:hypothetical protein
MLRLVRQGDRAAVDLPESVPRVTMAALWKQIGIHRRSRLVGIRRFGLVALYLWPSRRTTSPASFAGDRWATSAD